MFLYFTLSLRFDETTDNRGNSIGVVRWGLQRGSSSTTAAVWAEFDAEGTKVVDTSRGGWSRLSTGVPKARLLLQKRLREIEIAM